MDNRLLFSKAVRNLFPDAKYYIKNSELVWEEEKIEKPSFLKIEKEMNRIKEEENNNNILKQKKLQKEEELKALTIDINTVLYDANQEALGNFATVISIANATFNKAISIGIDGTVMSLEDAYNYVYKEQTVNKKGADNKWHTVQIASIVQTAQDAMTKKAEILAKY